LPYDENNEIINQYIALCYFNLGDLDKAKSYGLKVLEINPNNENMKSWLEKIRVLK
jgi:tetratricopeptide (TPR) repeat protein